MKKPIIDVAVEPQNKVGFLDAGKARQEIKLKGLMGPFILGARSPWGHNRYAVLERMEALLR